MFRQGLRFNSKSLKFKVGETQFTVRRERKSGFCYEDNDFFILEAGNEWIKPHCTALNVFAEATYSHQQAMRFSDIPIAFFEKFHHTQLVNNLNDCYVGFHPDEIVYLVWFTVDKICDNFVRKQEVKK